MPSDPNIGRILQNRYQLVGLLGQGAMGKVYEARNNLLGGVPVAVKFLSQTLLNQKMRDRFMREATTCALLGQRSMHIVNVTDYGVDEDEIPYYVMEYLKGDSLSEIIMRQPLPLPRFLNLTRQICLGLQCAHEGIPVDGEICPIVHRDIKPSNILITRDPSMGEVAKILDFGIAKTLQADSNQTNCFMGTLAYSSPEQMEGHELDARSDIYSLGVMMFQMLTGKMPLNADTHSFGGWYRAHHQQPPRSLAEANSSLRVPKALETLIMSCLAKSPGDRPQSANEVIKQLKPFEERYIPGLNVAMSIGDTLNKVPVTKTKPPLSPDTISRAYSWPADKPIGDISFPNPIRTDQGMLPSIWVMLSEQEIFSRQACTRYNQFLFAPAPHPSLLWLTVLYTRKAGARWLSCYLDLKTPQGQQMTRLLSESGQYRLLFFAKEEPQRCANVMTSTIALAQCERLKQWLTMGQMTPGLNQFNTTKTQLKLALEDLKPKILMKLESLYDDGVDLSG
ncbi:protein kinase [Thermoleptolyngbya oregonensis NK1-22]|uniref:Protein kinase n=1 Tax=Thermoleptolyngbya oregonensis NK1-22 TaxID=2547457 RepID=A0AA96YSZ1_9CYAN|nr:protein kinase [Thermoleptolyngbya oregonensis NK1-22]